VRLFAFVTAIAAIGSAAAVAAPVEDGYQLTKDKDGMLWVVRGMRRAPLRPGWNATTRVDGKARVATIEVASECSGDETLVFSFEQLESRLVNAESLVRHGKKDWAAAAQGFANAARLDPTWRLPAYNQASALSLLGEPAAAVAALKPWLASEPIATYVHVAADRELSPLLATPELAALRAAKPGSARVTAAGMTGGYGYSADRRLIAAQVDDSNGMSCQVSTSVVLVDATRGAVLATLQLSWRDGCKDGSTPTPVTPKTAAWIEKLLVDLGVAATPFEAGDAIETASGKRVVRLPKSRLGVVSTGSRIHVLRGDDTLASGPIGQPRLTWVTFLPDAQLMLIGSYRPSDSCPYNGLDALAVAAP